MVTDVKKVSKNVGFFRFSRIDGRYLLTNDLGMTYSYQTKSEGTVLAYNLVHHNWGRAPGNVGIYLDDMSQDHIVHHNLVYQVSEALALNPDAIATACPFCLTMLDDGVKDANAEEKVKVLDLAELLARAL